MASKKQAFFAAFKTRAFFFFWTEDEFSLLFNNQISCLFSVANKTGLMLILQNGENFWVLEIREAFFFVSKRRKALFSASKRKILFRKKSFLFKRRFFQVERPSFSFQGEKKEKLPSFSKDECSFLLFKGEGLEKK